MEIEISEGLYELLVMQSQNPDLRLRNLFRSCSEITWNRRRENNNADR